MTALGPKTVKVRQRIDREKRPNTSPRKVMMVMIVMMTNMGQM